MEKFNRGVRRHHRDRLLNNRKVYYGGIEERSNENQARILSMWVTTPTPCSCWMCGNPRRQNLSRQRFGRFDSFQERKAFFICED